MAIARLMEVAMVLIHMEVCTTIRTAMADSEDTEVMEVMEVLMDLVEVSEVSEEELAFQAKLELLRRIVE